MTELNPKGGGLPPRCAHIVEIDHLRGIAIAMTLMAHISVCFVQPVQWVSVVYSHAEFWGGVYLFFVISGYVITRSFWNDCADKNRPFREVARAFYGRRFFRIVPLAWVWIGCTLLFATAFNVDATMGDFRRNIVQAFAAATFTYNFVFPVWSTAFGIYWSLTLEEQFYLLFPLLARLNRRTSTPALALPIVVLAFLPRPAGTFLVFIPFDALCWGVLLGLAERAGVAAHIEPHFLRSPMARALSLAASLLSLVLIPSWLKPFPPATSLMVLACAWLVFCAGFDKGYARPGRAEGLRRLGLASFSLYLCHIPAFLLARVAGLLVRDGLGVDAAWLNAGSTILGLALAAVFTALSYRAVEVPTRRRGQRVRFGAGGDAPACHRGFDPAMANH